VTNKQTNKQTKQTTFLNREMYKMTTDLD